MKNIRIYKLAKYSRLRHTGSKTGTNFRCGYLEHVSYESNSDFRLRKYFRLRLERVLFRGRFSEACDRQKQL